MTENQLSEAKTLADRLWSAVASNTDLLPVPGGLVEQASHTIADLRTTLLRSNETVVSLTGQIGDLKQERDRLRVELQQAAAPEEQPPYQEVKETLLRVLEGRGREVAQHLLQSVGQAPLLIEVPYHRYADLKKACDFVLDLPLQEPVPVPVADVDLDQGEALGDHDPVNHPSHYTQGSIECIDAIEAALGREQFIGFLRGQVIKYQWRLGLKGAPVEDAEKSGWYNTRLAKTLKS